MARKPMVTRSFETMICEVMTVNIKTQKVNNTVCTLSRVITDTKKLENALRANFENSDDKFVAIVGTKTQTKLYGMSESDFLKYSVELDPETRKALEVEEDEENEEE